MAPCGRLSGTGRSIRPSKKETILFLEKGRYNPSLKLAFKVASALGSTIDEVFQMEEEDHL